MAELDRVICGLEHCGHVEGYCDKECPYWDEDNCGVALKHDAVALLKEQTKQYESGWNDAMDYAFRHGNGYRPYADRGLGNDDKRTC